MRGVWSEERKFAIWLEIETLACEAMSELGLMPEGDAKAIRTRGKFSVPEILEIEKRTNHDVIAFLENVASYVGPAARWIHQGLTSSDILDTTLGVQLTSACDILAEDLAGLRRAAAGMARQYRRTPMIGSACTPWLRPIIGVRRYCLAIPAAARRSPARSSARMSHAEVS